MSDWNPTQYLRFDSERLRPAIDLVARIAHPAPRMIYDLGCGTGSGTAMLRARYPAARIVGVDGSAAMLDRARTEVPDAEFVAADLAGWSAPEPADVIFTNAALQWLPDHPVLFPRLLKSLAPGGVLAVQMPAMDAEPIRRLQGETASNGPWREILAPLVAAAPRILPPPDYRAMIAPHVARIDMWETIYWHALQGEDAAVQWALGTSLRPFVDALAEPMRSEFLAAYAAAVRPHYTPGPDGRTLLPFRRLFLLAQAKG